MTITEPDRERDKVRAVFDRVLVGEPPLAPSPAPDGLVGRGRARVRRRRTTVAVAAIAVAGVAATVALALPGAGRSTDADPAPVMPAVTDGTGLGLTLEGEARIADAMVERLADVYPDAEISWTRIGTADDEVPPEQEPPQAALRFTVSGVDGYLDLWSLWGRATEGGGGSCTSWEPCPRQLAIGTSWGPTGAGRWVASRSTDVGILNAAVTLPELTRRVTMNDLLDAEAIRVRPGDLDQPVPLAVTPSRPDEQMTSDLRRLRVASDEWAADFGLRAAMPLFTGTVSATAELYRSASIHLSESVNGGDGLSVGMRLSGEDPDVADFGCGNTRVCDEVATDDGRVVGFTEGRGAYLSYLRGDGVAVTWRFWTVPDGWTLGELMDYVGSVGVPIEPR